MENKIILTTKGNISGADKQALRRAGVCIAEVKDISAIRLISGVDYFDLDDISLSAIEALRLTQYSSETSRFANKLLDKIVAKKAEPAK